jgi:hypothetical protein
MKSFLLVLILGMSLGFVSCKKKESTSDKAAEVTIVASWKLTEGKTNTYISGTLTTINEVKNINSFNMELKSDGTYTSNYDYTSLTTTVSNSSTTSTPVIGSENGTYTYDKATGKLTLTNNNITSNLTADISATNLTTTLTIISGAVKIETVNKYTKK